MIASFTAAASGSTDLHAHFLALMPRIELHATIYFRHVKCPGKKADRIAETIALAWKWFIRLMERGKDPAAFVTTFASLAARAVRNGRRVCGQEKAKDVLSPRAQQIHGFTVQSLPASTRTSHEKLYTAVHGQQRQDTFEERFRDNTVTPPDEQAIFRIDFPDWLATWGERDRRMIEDMGLGERTKDLSRKYGVSPGRISQKRQLFHDDWQRFHGEVGPDPEAETVEATGAA